MKWSIDETITKIYASQLKGKKMGKNKYHNFKTKNQNLKMACKDWRKNPPKKLKNHYKSYLETFTQHQIWLT